MVLCRLLLVLMTMFTVCALGESTYDGTKIANRTIERVSLALELNSSGRNGCGLGRGMSEETDNLYSRGLRRHRKGYSASVEYGVW